MKLKKIGSRVVAMLMAVAVVGAFSSCETHNHYYGSKPGGGGKPPAKKPPSKKPPSTSSNTTYSGSSGRSYRPSPESVDAVTKPSTYSSPY